MRPFAARLRCVRFDTGSRNQRFCPLRRGALQRRCSNVRPRSAFPPSHERPLPGQHLVPLPARGLLMPVRIHGALDVYQCHCLSQHKCKERRDGARVIALLNPRQTGAWPPTLDLARESFGRVAGLDVVRRGGPPNRSHTPRLGASPDAARGVKRERTSRRGGHVHGRVLPGAARVGSGASGW